jgi:phosphonate transport system substrate-binding protein
MRKAILAIVCLAVSMMLSIAEAQTLRFSPLPMQDRETVVKQFKPMTTYLEKSLNVKIVYDYSDSYAGILEKFKQSFVDLAYLGPLPYVELRASATHAEPLVRFKEKSGQTTYTCSLVTFPDAFFDANFAKGRKIALTQPLSTCGYLSVSGLMRDLGSSLEDNLYRYIGKHDTVALSVLEGQFDAGGLKSAIAKEYAHLGLETIAETPPLPAFALVGNTRTLPPEVTEEIRRQMIALEPDGKDKKILSYWGENIRYGAVLASDDDYKPVRDLLGETTIPEKGNH